MANYGTFTDNGNSSDVYVSGPCVFHAAGTWGSGTITLKFLSDDKTTWKNYVTATALTSDATGQVLIDLPSDAGTILRATLAGATTPSLTWEFRGRSAASV